MSRVAALRRRNSDDDIFHSARRKVGFRWNNQIILIPAISDYEDHVKSDIWWKKEDYDNFFSDYLLELKSSEEWEWNYDEGHIPCTSS